MILQQFNTYTQLNSQYLIQIKQVVRSNRFIYLIMEYIDGKTLSQIITEKKTLNEEEAGNYLLQILKSFKDLNEWSILHRDLQPKNFIQATSNLKLSNFGVARKIEGLDPSYKVKNVNKYSSPQVLDGQQFTSRADVWSIGIIFY